MKHITKHYVPILNIFFLFTWTAKYIQF